MGIDLRSGDAFMPQHFLNGPEVRSSFYQMGGKGVPKSMWTDIFFDACQLGGFFDD